MRTKWTRRTHDTGTCYLHLLEPPQFCCQELGAAWADHAVGVLFGSERIEIWGETRSPGAVHPISFCPFCAVPIVMEIDDG